MVFNHKLPILLIITSLVKKKIKKYYLRGEFPTLFSLGCCPPRVSGGFCKGRVQGGLGGAHPAPIHVGQSHLLPPHPGGELMGQASPGA